MTKDFVHLHLHTKGSLADAMLKEGELAKVISEMGMSAVAITDHGNMFNVIRFYKACKREGVKPIIGIETYVAPRSNTLKVHKVDDANYHLVLLAENMEGYQNLINISSDSSVNGMYYRPRTDKSRLKEWNNGLIALSACLGGEVQQHLLDNDYLKAKETALEYDSIFGRGNFYLELQDHGIEEQKIVNELLIKLSKETGIPLVCTNDCHYLTNNDYNAHDVLMAIQAKTTIYDDKRKKYSSDQFYVKSKDEMWDIFGYIPEALENTVKIAERCNVEIEFGRYKLPKFKLPSDFKGNSDNYLRKLAYEGCKDLYGELSEDVVERAEYELSVVENMGFADYFLITGDIFRFCREGTDEADMEIKEDWVPILTSPGRGCFFPGSKVLMSDCTTKSIEDVKIGDQVITHTGEVNKVYATPSYDVKEVLCQIKAGGNDTITLTSDHQVLTLKTERCANKGQRYIYCKSTCKYYSTCKFKKDQVLEWVEAKNIRVGDMLCYPKHKLVSSDVTVTDLLSYDSRLDYDNNFVWYTKNNKIKRFIPHNGAFARLAAYYIGNGYSHVETNNSKIEISFHSKRSDLIDDAKDLFYSVFGVRLREYKNKRGTCTKLENGSKIIAMFMGGMCGTISGDKRIPVSLMTKDKKIIGELLYGLMNTDGYLISKENKVSYSTTSEYLIYQVQALFSELGIYAAINRYVHKNKLWSDELRVVISGKQLFKLKNYFPEINIKKQAYYTNRFMEDDKYFYIRVDSIDTKYYEGRVYDLSVNNNPSYMVNGFAVHNSAASSILLYALGVTRIDPLKYDLLFDRFLDSSRVSMPDVDSDFEYERRQEVIDYIVRKYGQQSVCQIITYSTLAARASIRAVGRALDLPYQVQDQVAKMIPPEPGMTITKAMEMNPDFKNRYESDHEVKKLIDIALRVEGLPVYTSTHAAGVLIVGAEGVTSHVPVWDSDGAIVSQYDMIMLEELGLLKLDILGLRTLGVIRETMNFVKKNHGHDIDLDKLYKCEDTEPFKLLADGMTDGLFQIEGSAMSGFIKEMKPKSIEEWVAAISLYRPGPMAFIPDYLRNRRNEDLITYKLKGLEKILGETYGIMVYQEQVMKAVIEIAGYDKSDSDSFRKVMGKKKLDLVPVHKRWFLDGRKQNDLDEYGKMKDYGHEIPGGLNLGHNKEDLEEFFEMMASFASYGFNKSHAASYAVVGYLTAWLKYYYPSEFMAALMNSFQGNQKRMYRYINHCRKDLNIDVVAPDINVSSDRFIPLKDGRILYTLNAKGVSVKALEVINKERAISPFVDFEDFIVRTIDGVGKGDIAALASIGALKSIGVVSSQIVAGVEDIADRMSKTKQAQKRAEKSGREFDRKEWMQINNQIPDIAEFPNDVVWALEKEYLGLYLTGHPIYNYMYHVEKYSDFKLSDMDYEVDEDTGIIIMNADVPNGKRVRVIAMFSEVKETVTRAKKERMAITEIEDLTGSIKMLIWPNIYSKYQEYIKEGNVLDITAYAKIEPDEQPVLILESLSVLENERVTKIVIKEDSHSKLRKIMNRLLSNRLYRGDTPVYIESNNIKLLLDSRAWINLKYTDLNGINYEIIE